MYVCMYLLQREKFSVHLVIPSKAYGNLNVLIVRSSD